MSRAELVGLLISVISFGPLLYLAALGELIAEKSGVLNLGVEGIMAMGGVTGFWAGVQFGNPWMALLVAAIVGGLFASIHGLMSVVMGADQVVSGLALTILGLGLSAFIGKDYVSRAPGAQFNEIDLGPLSDLGIVGDTLFSMNGVSWLTIALGIITWFVLTRTQMGLSLRAVGESAATARGSRVPRGTLSS